MPYGAEENWYHGGQYGGPDPFLELMNRQTDRGIEQRRDLGNAQAEHQRQMGDITRDTYKTGIDAYYRGAEENRTNRDFAQKERLRESQEKRAEAGEERLNAEEQRTGKRFDWEGTDRDRADYEYNTLGKQKIDDQAREGTIRREKMLQPGANGQTGYGRMVDNELSQSDLNLANAKRSGKLTDAQLANLSEEGQNRKDDRDRARLAEELQAIARMKPGPERDRALDDVQRRRGRIDPNELKLLASNADANYAAKQSETNASRDFMKANDWRFQRADADAQQLGSKLADVSKIAKAAQRYEQSLKYGVNYEGDIAGQVRNDTMNTLAKHGRYDLMENVDSPGPITKRSTAINESARAFAADLDKEVRDYVNSLKGTPYINEPFVQNLIAENQKVQMALNNQNQSIDITGGAMMAGGGGPQATPVWAKGDGSNAAAGPVGPGRSPAQVWQQQTENRPAVQRTSAPAVDPRITQLQGQNINGGSPYVDPYGFGRP